MNHLYPKFDIQSDITYLFVDKRPDIQLNHLHPQLDIQSDITYFFITVLDDDILEDDILEFLRTKIAFVMTRGLYASRLLDITSNLIIRKRSNRNSLWAHKTAKKSI